MAALQAAGMAIDEDVWTDFSAAVNMTEKELEHWLGTDENRSAGQKPSGGGESTGHESGREIVALIGRKKGDLDEDDEHQMRRVVSYVHRHLAQHPTHEDVESSRWRRSLMNWGHDPLRD